MKTLCLLWLLVIASSDGVNLCDVIGLSNVLTTLPAGNYFAGWTCQQIKSAMGTFLQPMLLPNGPPTGSFTLSPSPSKSPFSIFSPTPSATTSPGAIPTSWDWRTQRSDCMAPVRSQGQCGCCWAFASTSALGNRFCIVNSAFPDLYLAPQNELDCDRDCSSGTNPTYCQDGCNGGYLDLTWNHFVSTGVVTASCYPYAGTQQTCKSSCSLSSKAFSVYKAANAYTLTTVTAMQQDIMTNGPISVGLMVYEDFLSYSGGVYTVNSANSVGGHAVKMIGWGVANGVAYWICENSWSDSWGESGYFRIRRGTNEAQIESYVAAGQPLNDGSQTYNPDDGTDSTTRSKSAASIIAPSSILFLATVAVCLAFFTI